VRQICWLRLIPAGTGLDEGRLTYFTSRGRVTVGHEDVAGCIPGDVGRPFEEYGLFAPVYAPWPVIAVSSSTASGLRPIVSMTRHG
jgi:hypothetical protein